ncbi:MAG: hypothetical protein JST01_14385 [Cyanobacteria bacterium SZAS TMP-1]|nr:hypothetical protein [Cyanobacteria bacterium SZAS TMP-1]
MSAVSFDKFPPAEEPATADDDIFGAFGVEEPETDDGRVVAIIEEDFMGTGKRFFVAIDGNHVEEFDSIEAAREAIPEWKKYLAEEQTLQAAAPVKPAKEPKAKPLCAVCNNVAVNKNSPVLDGQKVCKKCHLESDLPKPTEEAATGSGDLPEGYIAFRNMTGTIYGIGKTPDDARKDADNTCAFEAEHEEPPMWIVAPASKALLSAVEVFGGDGVDWTYDGGVAVVAPKSQDVSSATASQTAPESIAAAAAPSTATEAAPAQDATTAQTPADVATAAASAADSRAQDTHTASPASETSSAFTGDSDPKPAATAGVTPEEDAPAVTAASTSANDAEAPAEAAESEVATAPVSLSVTDPKSAAGVDADSLSEQHSTTEQQSADGALSPGSADADPKLDAGDAGATSPSTSTESLSGSSSSAVTATETLETKLGFDVSLPSPEEVAEIEQRYRLMTEAGLIDPITGEVLEPSLIMRKFGWTELPVLRQDATREEADAFERKLDQVLDKVASHQEKAARRRAAAELRCKPHDSAAEFWFNEFVTPMAKMLAPHRLQRMKNGEYKSKTMVLDSGAVKFTQAGGWSVHDAALVKSYIEKEGVEKFTAIGAKREITYSYPKLVGALNKGVFKDIPGTVKRAKDPFAKVQMVALSGPKTKEGAEEDSE